jgi:predicted O-linked N-acetylglucosamine transferase (SPINDLY family)
VSRLITRTLELHERSQFDVIGYAVKEPADHPVASRFMHAFDDFYDISQLDDISIQKKVQKDQIDIAVDLTGHTLFSRSKIFGQRLAPIQINYLGFPGTMGAKCMDYIVADRNLIPASCEEHYTEKVIFLPDCYQAQDELYEITKQKSRSDLGLPLDGFVWCAVNNSYKITRDVFDVWMRLLLRKSDSVLWLYMQSKHVKNNLCREAEIRGVDPSRLVFSEKCPYEEYLDNFRCADVFLDTFAYNAGATASDALRMGLPVVTKRGSSYAARMASSLLIGLNMPELIADSVEGYEDIATRLAESPDHLNAVRLKLVNSLHDAPLFNPQLFTKHLESGYKMAFDRLREGLSPDNIFVNPST